MLNQASTANWFIRHNLRTQLRTQCFNLLWNQKKYIKIISLDYIYLYTKTIIKCPFIVYLLSWRRGPWRQKCRGRWKVIRLGRPGSILTVLHTTVTKDYWVYSLVPDHSALYHQRFETISKYSFRGVFVYNDTMLDFWILSINSWSQYVIYGL